MNIKIKLIPEWDEETDKNYLVLLVSVDGNNYEEIDTSDLFYDVADLGEIDFEINV